MQQGTTSTENTKTRRFYSRATYKKEPFPANNYNEDPRYKAFLAENFIPSIKRNEERGKVVFDFQPLRPGANYLNEKFPADYESTERFLAFTRHGYRVQNVRANPDGDGSVLLDFVHPQTLEGIVQTKTEKSESVQKTPIVVRAREDDARTLEITNQLIQHGELKYSIIGAINYILTLGNRINFRRK